MIRPAEWRRVLALTLLILIVQALPYLAASTRSPEGMLFGGMLLNPLDGNSYLAKMQAGARGEWTFRLPYTADPGPGVAIYGYYLFLGHAARWLSLDMLWVYHSARALGGAAMFLAFYAFVARFFDSPRERLAAWLFGAIGSGFGWVAAGFGLLMPDLWVREAIPFLTAFVNAHFALGSAAILWIFLAILRPEGTLASRRANAMRAAAVALSTLALCILQPQSVAGVGWVLAGWVAWRLVEPMRIRPGSPETQRWPEWAWREFWPIVLFGVIAIPVLAYTYWATTSLPAFAAWAAQNETASPPFWDYAIAFGPGLLLIVPGVREAWRGGRPLDRFPVVWFVMNLVALYLPVTFQRRLSMGIFFPLAVLAVMGLRRLFVANPVRFRLSAAALLLISVPSNALVMLAGPLSTDPQKEALYLHAAEAEALGWMRANLAPDSIVLAAPETGLFIPAHSHAHVIYGHPLETVRAAEREAEVRRFFSETIPQAEAEAYLSVNGVDYVFVGPRELRLGTLLPVRGLVPVYTHEGVVIYSAQR